MENKLAFIEFMLESNVLMFGDFVTKSGRNTPYFINTGNYTTSAQIAKLGEFYAESIQDQFGDSVTNLFGPAYKGIPIGIAAGCALQKTYGVDLTLSFNRKEAKDHGEGGWILGHPYGRGEKEDKVVIVEDVTTAGTSIRETLPSINKFDKTEVIGLLVSVNRLEKGQGNCSALKELSEEYGIKTLSLINFFDLLEYLSEHAIERGIGLDILDKMKAYHEKYGVEE
ncbi:MAG: orotate phosphoribosyltransferase [Fibrobacteria bacterium]|nr:orotate phosphoribosyltransferase [Fibrobacteria bacterium]